MRVLVTDKVGSVFAYNVPDDVIAAARCVHDWWSSATASSCAACAMPHCQITDLAATVAAHPLLRGLVSAGRAMDPRKGKPAMVMGARVTPSPAYSTSFRLLRCTKFSGLMSELSQGETLRQSLGATGLPHIADSNEPAWAIETINRVPESLQTRCHS